MEELAQQKEALIQETIKQLKSQSQAKENTANTATPSAQPVKAETANSANVEPTKAAQPALTVAAEAPIIPATKPISKPVPTVFEDEDEPETKPFYKKKVFLYSALGLVALAAGTTWYFHQGWGSASRQLVPVRQFLLAKRNRQALVKLRKRLLKNLKSFMLASLRIVVRQLSKMTSLAIWIS